MDVLVLVVIQELKTRATVQPLDVLQVSNFTLSSVCVFVCVLQTNTDVLVGQRQRGVSVVTKATVLTILPPRVVFTAHTCDHVDEVDVAAAVGVTITLTV